MTHDHTCRFSFGRDAAVRLLGVVALVLGAGRVEAAAVQLDPLFGDHMVMQRSVPVPVWGRATPGEPIEVTIDQQTKTVTADATGAWLVRLAAMEVGAPRTLTVRAASGSLTVNDVLLGEVWVGSGQSNMALDVAFFAQNDQVLATAAAQSHPQVRLFSSKGWQEGTAENQIRFSAQLFFFCISLQHELDVPVGLICRAVSGSPSVPWLSEAAFQADAPIQSEIAQYAKAHPTADADAQKKYEQDLAAWEKAYGAQAPKETTVASTAAVPHFKPVPPNLVAGTGRRGVFYEKHIRPLIPYAIRGILWDQGESGTGMAGVANNGYVMTALVRSWRKDWGQGDFPFVYVQKGGAGCALDSENPVNRGAAVLQPLPPEPPTWPWSPTGPDLRDVAHAIMVPTTDLDHSGGGHPANKSGYGARDCQVVLRAIYGKPGAFSGPAYASCTVDGGTLRVTFTGVGAGLTCPVNQHVQGFAIAGADKVFAWADAVIDGSTVVLSSARVPHPTQVQYRSAPWANLFNRDGFPALSLRGSVEVKP